MRDAMVKAAACIVCFLKNKENVLATGIYHLSDTDRTDGGFLFASIGKGTKEKDGDIKFALCEEHDNVGQKLNEFRQWIDGFRKMVTAEHALAAQMLAAEAEEMAPEIDDQEEDWEAPEDEDDSADEDETAAVVTKVNTTTNLTRKPAGVKVAPPASVTFTEATPEPKVEEVKYQQPKGAEKEAMIKWHDGLPRNHALKGYSIPVKQGIMSRALVNAWRRTDDYEMHLAASLPQ